MGQINEWVYLFYFIFGPKQLTRLAREEELHCYGIDLKNPWIFKFHAIERKSRLENQRFFYPVVNLVYEMKCLLVWMSCQSIIAHAKNSIRASNLSAVSPHVFEDRVSQLLAKLSQTIKGHTWAYLISYYMLFVKFVNSMSNVFMQWYF